MARIFNGSSDCITMTTGSGPLQPPDPMSLATWFYAPSFGNDNYLVANLNNFNDGVGLIVGTTGTFACQTGGGTYVGSTLSTGLWYHLAMTVISGTVRGYVNGALDGAPVGTTGIAYNLGGNNSRFSVGARQWVGSTDKFVLGNIADVAIWSAGLTLLEMAALARGRRPSQIRPKSLNGYWPLAGLQSPEPDLSGNANNGTLTGSQPIFGPPLAPTPTTRNRSFMLFSPTPPRIYGIAGFASAEW